MTQLITHLTASVHRDVLYGVKGPIAIRLHAQTVVTTMAFIDARPNPLNTPRWLSSDVAQPEMEETVASLNLL